MNLPREHRLFFTYTVNRFVRSVQITDRRSGRCNISSEFFTRIDFGSTVKTGFFKIRNVYKLVSRKKPKTHLFHFEGELSDSWKRMFINK